MLFRTFRKLSTSTSHSVSNNTGGQSYFAYLRKAGTELADTVNPTDLKSLVRVVSAVNSFRYPAFKPTLNKVVHKSDPAWMEQLVADASVCPQGKALEYLKTLSQSEIPRDVLDTLMKRVQVSTRRDLEDFITAIKQLHSNRLDTSVRNATTYMVKNAINNNMRLSTYMKIWDMVHHHWQVGRKHVIPTKMRSDLIQATWSSMLRSDFLTSWSATSADSFTDVVCWLSMAESNTQNHKKEITRVLDRIEVMSRTIQLPTSSITSILSHMLVHASRNQSIAEPLDSISQNVLKKFSKSSSSSIETDDLIRLARAIEFYITRHNPVAQLESIMESILPITVENLKRNITQIPSRYLPTAFALLSRFDADLVAQEISRRGHEMDGSELVKSLNAAGHYVSTATIVEIFSSSLNDIDSVTELVSSLSLSDKLELLTRICFDNLTMNDSVSVFVQGLVESTRASISEGIISAESLSLETLIRMYSLTGTKSGDEFESMTGVDVSRLLNEFLASPKGQSEMTISHAISLIGCTNSGNIRSSLMEYLSSTELSVYDNVRLLGALSGSGSDTREVVKKIVPKIDTLDDQLTELLRFIPNELMGTGKPTNSPMGRGWCVSKYTPVEQLREAVLDRIEHVVDKMDFNQVSSCLAELARLDYYSPKAIDRILSRLTGLLSPNTAAGNIDDLTKIANSMCQLGVFDEGIFSHIIGTISNSRRGGLEIQNISILINACNYFGYYRNEKLIGMIESILRSQAAMLTLTDRICLIHALAKNNVYSPLFQDQLRLVMDDCSKDVSSVSEEDWKKVYEINLCLLVEAPPKIKIKYMNEKFFKSFIDDNCSYSWYVGQEKYRNKFIHSTIRGEIQDCMQSLGWSMRVPELGKEVYHIDFVSSGSENNDQQRAAVVVVPRRDELRQYGVRVIIGDSGSKIRHLQMFGYKVIPISEMEWSATPNQNDRKDILLNSNRVFATSVSSSY